MMMMMMATTIGVVDDDDDYAGEVEENDDDDDDDDEDEDEMEMKKTWWWWRWWRWCFEDGGCLYWRCCDYGDGKIIFWQSVLATTFWENKNPSRAFSGIGCVCPDGVSPDGWWCLSPCWCLGGLSIVFRWSLASWWHFGGVSVSLDGVRWCFESCSCCGVSVVFWWCSGGVLVVWKKRRFFKWNGSPDNTKLASTEMGNFAIGVVCWVNLFYDIVWSKEV